MLPGGMPIALSTENGAGCRNHLQNGTHALKAQSLAGQGPLLVGTDFSDSAAAALLEARRLSKRLGSAPFVLHAVTCPAEALWEADTTATRWLESVSLAPEHIDARAGRPWLVLIHAAEELRASGIVLGGRGRSGYQPFRLGSVAERVSLIAPCPVVIVSPRLSSGSGRDWESLAGGDALLRAPAAPASSYYRS